MIGRQIGPYRVIAELGSGGMGIVYRARDDRLQRDVALKVLREGQLATEAIAKRFQREAVALSQVRHPHVAHAYDVGTENGLNYLVMELVEGTPLSQTLADGPLSLERLREVAEQLLSGVEALHAAGLAHRDLKPSNVIWGSDGRLRIVDLGLASDVGPADDEGPTRSYTRYVGSLPYMSPEQLRGDPPTTATDIWATGVILYKMATGKRPYEAGSVFELVKAIGEAPPVRPSKLRPDLPASLDSLIVDCLSLDPKSRPTASAVLARLRNGSPVPASQARSVALLRAAAILGVALLATFGVLMLRRWGETTGSVDTPSDNLVARQILTTGTSKEDVQRDPAGGWVSWIDGPHRSRHLRVSRPEGGEGVDLVAGTMGILSHGWSPDGQEIAYLALRGEDVSLEIVPAPLGGFVRLRDELPAHLHRIVAWEGSRLFLESRGSSLWTYDTETRELAEILAPEGFDYVRDWDVAASSGRVLFSGQIAGAEDLWITSLEGSSPRRLSDDPYRDYSARFMDGEGLRIALVSSRGGPNGLWLLDVKSGGFQPLPTAAPVVRISDASAHGLLVSTQRTQGDVWRRSAGGLSTLLISDTRQDLQISAAENGNFVVQRVAQDRDRPSVIEESMLIGFEGSAPGTPRNLVDNGFLPSLSPSGRFLAYATVEAGEFAVWRLDLESMQPQRVSGSAYYAGRKSFPFAYLPPVALRWTPDGALDFTELLPDRSQSIRRLEEGAETARTLYTSSPGVLLLSFAAEGGEAGRLALLTVEASTGRPSLEIWRNGEIVQQKPLAKLGVRRLLGWYGERLLSIHERVPPAEPAAKVVDILEPSDPFEIEIPGGVPATALASLDRHRVTLTTRSPEGSSVVRVDLKSRSVETIVLPVIGEVTFCCFAEVGDELLYVKEQRSRDVWSFEADPRGSQ